MPTIQQLSIYSQTALASYAINLEPGGNNTSAYVADKVTMAMSQATDFNATWEVIDQSPTGNYGFSAVLLQNRVTGEKVLSIAGTDISSLADVITDVVNVIAAGTVLGMPQYASLESFYTQLVSSGKLGASEQITVTGHSLGGFLAQAFTARHTSVVSAAYTYSAPGFGSAELLLGFLGLTNTAAASAKITNVHATDGLSMTAGLGVMLGSSQPVRIEAGIDPFENHSIVTLGDALSVYKVYSDLQPSLSMEQAASLFVSSGLSERKLESALDALRTVFIGSASNDVNKTPTGDREAFFNNLTALNAATGPGSLQSLKGQVQLVGAASAFANLAQADNHTALAYRYALLELLPFAVVANTEAANQTLYGYYAERLSLYDASSGQGALTQTYLQDRNTMLTVVIQRNQAEAQGILPGSSNLRYFDAATNTDVLVGAGSAQRLQYLFGADAADTLTGQGLADHLYGGAGNDTLNGKGGADYLEGGKGMDTYVFGAYSGFDTVLDADGLGALQFEGLVFSGVARQVYGMNNAWRNDSGELLFTKVKGPGSTQDLLITRYASATDKTIIGTVRLQNWQEGQLGLSLGGAVAANEEAFACAA